MWLIEYGIKIVEIIIYFLIIHLILTVFVELNLIKITVHSGPSTKELIYTILAYSIIYILLKFIFF